MALSASRETYPFVDNPTPVGPERHSLVLQPRSDLRRFMPLGSACQAQARACRQLSQIFPIFGPNCSGQAEDLNSICRWMSSRTQMR